MAKTEWSPAERLFAERLAANLRAERARRGWKQSELAERVGVSQSAVAQWERAAKDVRLADIVVLMGVLDVPARRLLGDDLIEGLVSESPAKVFILFSDLAHGGDEVEVDVPDESPNETPRMRDLV